MLFRPEPVTSTGVCSPGRGIPYHLLGRSPAHRWWRPLAEMALLTVLALAFILLLFGAASGLAAAMGTGIDAELGFVDPVWNIAAGLAAIAVLLPAIGLTTRWAGKRPMGTVSSVEGRLRWRWLLDCGRWALLCFALVIGVQFVRGPAWDPSAWPGWPTFLGVLALALVLIPFQAAAEEYLCRGWLVQIFASWTRTPWPGVVLSSVLFLALHEYTDPLALADLLVFATALCWLTIRTGGLEAAIALHVVNNVVATVLEATQGVPGLDQSGTYSLWDIVPMTVSTLLYTWWIDRRARRLGLTTKAPLPTA